MSNRDSTLFSVAVYFIRFGEFGPIKIGMTREDPMRRLKLLQVGSPKRLHLMGVIKDPAPEHSERILHQRFRPSRIRGEWFKPCQELLEFIATHATIPKRRRNKTREQIKALRELDFWGPDRDPDGIIGTLPMLVNIARSPVRGWRRVALDPFEQAKHVRALTYRVEGISVKGVADRMGVTARTIRNWSKLARAYFGYPDIRLVRSRLRKLQQ